MRAGAGATVWFVNGSDAVDALPAREPVDAVGRRARRPRHGRGAVIAGAGRGQRRRHGRATPRTPAARCSRCGPYRRGGALGATFLALDAVGAGMGDDVLVGRPPGYARELVGGPAPVRSIVLGILDAPPEDAAA